MSTETVTKREKRLAAREERKRRAAAAQQRAKRIRFGLILAGLLLLGIIGYTAFTTSFFGLATPTVGRAMPLEKADHVPEGSSIAYGTRPPTSGPHYSAWYPTYGLVEQPIPPGNWVHNLEHGAVVLLYNCPQGCPELVTQIRQFIPTLPMGNNARRGVPRILATPYTDMNHKIAVVAWGRLLELDEFDPDQIRRFYEAYIDRGPECQNRVCPD